MCSVLCSCEYRCQRALLMVSDYIIIFAGGEMARQSVKLQLLDQASYFPTSFLRRLLASESRRLSTAFVFWFPPCFIGRARGVQFYTGRFLHGVRVLCPEPACEGVQVFGPTLALALPPNGDSRYRCPQEALLTIRT